MRSWFIYGYKNQSTEEKRERKEQNFPQLCQIL